MLFIYLYDGVLYSVMWKSDLYFRSPRKKCENRPNVGLYL